MPLLAVGTSHKTAPLEIREKFAVPATEYGPRMRELHALPEVEEAVLVSTCNRTEVYGIVSPDAPDCIHQWLYRSAGLDAATGASHFYAMRNAGAVEHLFRVASGLDSLVLGEPQILGQLKQSWQLAHEAGTVGKVTDRLFQQAFATGKAVRSETGISTHPTSVAYIVTILAKQIFGDLQRQKVVLIGAGEMIELCGRHFRQQGIGELVIVNRSVERAQMLADRYDARAVSLEDLEAVLPEADILVSSTASPTPIISRSAVAAALKARRRRPMFLVDIAVPRDMEASIAELDSAYLYTIDDLQQVADENLVERHRAAEAAEESVRNSVYAFMRWLHGIRAADSLQRLRGHAERSGQQLAARAANRIRAGHDPAEVLSQLADTLTHRILHGPTKRLREAAEEQDYEMLRAADWLFDSSLAPDEGDSE
ncbi:MAG: glutamyl-tRNA reductase [Xanthomonadales bacterium]|nr:glutamyl-tRNA reductase [Xanthomonadales bacterium]